MRDKRSRGTATCLLLDSGSILIARGIHQNIDGGRLVEIKVFDGDTESVMDADIVQLLSIQKDGPTRLCHVLERTGETVLVEPLRTLDEQVRRNLRIPFEFETFAYPIYPEGNGRIQIRAFDLSCGGIAFFSDRAFLRGDKMEIVVPTSPEPLVLKCQILRLCAERQGVKLYAAKFIDMINDEETKVRETVFGVQLRSRG